MKKPWQVVAILVTLFALVLWGVQSAAADDASAPASSAESTQDSSPEVAAGVCPATTDGRGAGPVAQYSYWGRTVQVMMFRLSNGTPCVYGRLIGAQQNDKVWITVNGRDESCCGGQAYVPGGKRTAYTPQSFSGLNVHSYSCSTVADRPGQGPFCTGVWLPAPSESPGTPRVDHPEAEPTDSVVSSSPAEAPSAAPSGSVVSSSPADPPSAAPSETTSGSQAAPSSPPVSAAS